MSSKQRGFTMVEAIVAVMVFVIGVVGLVQVTLVAKSTSERGRDLIQVNGYLKEGLDAVRTIRNAGWNNLDDGSFRLVAQPGTNPPWNLQSGSESIGKFSRTVEISAVRRDDTDGSGALSAGDQICQGTNCGSFDDPDTKKVTITVTWPEGTNTASRSTFAYLTNWQ